MRKATSYTTVGPDKSPVHCFTRRTARGFEAIVDADSLYQNGPLLRHHECVGCGETEQEAKDDLVSKMYADANAYMRGE